MSDEADALSLHVVHHLGWTFDGDGPGDEVYRAFDRFLASLQARRIIGDEPLTMDDAEAATIQRALDATGGKLSEAAAMLGMHRNTLGRKIERYDLDKTKKPTAVAVR